MSIAELRPFDGKTDNYFPLLFLLLDLESGIRDPRSVDGKKSGSGIII
jgi:hypothetical protein